MTRFLHLTDLHITPEGDTLPALDRALDIARRIDPAPEFIVVSGDLTDRGDAESYAILAARMAGLDVPVIYALGNHDHRAAFHTAFPGHPGASDGPLDHDHVIAGLHVIVLDSSVPGRTSGGLQTDQFELLAATLAAHPGRPKVLVIHHPPASGAVERAWAQLDPGDSDRLAGLIAGTDLRVILSGHIHLNRLSVWHGIPVVTPIGLHSTIDLTDEVTRSGGLAIVGGAGLGICDLTETGVNYVFVPLWPGEARRTVSPDQLAALR